MGSHLSGMTFSRGVDSTNSYEIRETPAGFLN